MWCRSIASGGIDLSTELPDSIWMWLTPPAKAPDKPTTLTLELAERLASRVKWQTTAT